METVVYRHIRPDNNEVFYVGIGKNTRPSCVKSRNRMWRFVVAKNNGDYIIDVVATLPSRDLALELEELMISEYGKKCDGNGTLCNIADGYYQHSKETLLKISSSKKGKKISKQTRRKMSERMIGNSFGFKKGQVANNAKEIIITIDGLDMHFPSVTSAARHLGTSNQTLLRRLETNSYYKWDKFKARYK